MFPYSYEEFLEICRNLDEEPMTEREYAESIIKLKESC